MTCNVKMNGFMTYNPVNSSSVVSSLWKGDNRSFCAVESCGLWFERIPPPAKFEPVPLA